MPGSGRSPGGGRGYPLQSSCLENPWRGEPDGLQRVRHDSVCALMASARSVWKICREGRRKTTHRPPAPPGRWLSRRDPAQPALLGLRSQPSWKLPPSLLFPTQSSPLLAWPPCQWLTASHGLLGEGVWLLSFKHDGSQNKLLFYAHTFLAIWISSKL